MIKPLSRKKRFILLVLCLGLFLIIAPTAILFATGYRLGEAFELTRTGGLYVAVGQSGAKIYINDELVKETGLFQRGFLLQNLKPDEYKIRVEKDALFVWEKMLPVYPTTVTDARVFMIAKEPKLEEIVKEIRNTSTSTNNMAKAGEINPDYEKVVQLFSKENYASSTEPKTTEKLELGQDKRGLTLLWTGKENTSPSYFCNNIECEKEIIIEMREVPLSFFFFPGRDDLIIYSTSSGIFVIEADGRGGRNIQPVWEKRGLDLWVEDGSIFIKDGKKYFVASL